ncbi:MAG: 3-phosphoshikimate 1-carboxyvinyltransferase [Halanaerobiales bacterium]|nr:3-phosphoshikimate 1-carboxyvinyltransferase [Halanaerobiales bacterium]
MLQIKVQPVQRVEGEVSIPGDKSISHRSILFGALTNGRVEIDNFLMGEDCLHTAKLIQDLGVSVTVNPSIKQVIVEGVGKDGLKESNKVLNVGNAGTLIRIGSGLLAACQMFSVVTGDESIRGRPMRRIVEPLTRMGARIWGREENSLAPLAIQGGRLQGYTHISKHASAQVKSAILLAGLLAESGETVVKEPTKSRDHTERMLKYLGADLEVDDNTVQIKPQNYLQARPIYVPGDISSAAFILATAILKTDSEVVINNVGYNPTRNGIIQVLKMMGGEIRIFNQREVNGEPIVDLRITPSQLHGIQLNGSLIPNVIDEIPIIAVLATQAHGKTVISEAQELRVKESDRIRTIVAGLQKLGAKVEERSDGMIIEGPIQLKGGEVESYGDHRIAMSLVVAGLVADDETLIRDTDCINTSFPGFIEIIQRITGKKAIFEIHIE